LKKLIFTIISLSLNFHCYSQDLIQTLKIAESLFSNSSFENAIIYYERVVYFEEIKSPDILTKLGDCYFYTEKYDKALNSYNIAYNLEKDTIKINDLLFKKASIFFLQGDYDIAYYEMHNIYDINPYYVNKKKFYNGFINIEREEYEIAKSNFITAIGSDTCLIIKINNSFNHFFKQNKRLKTRKAKTLSYIMPGLGQLYIKDYKNAINSFVLNGSLLSLFIIVASKYSYINALFSAGVLFQRYYYGGIVKMDASVNKRKEIIKAILISEILKIFEHKLQIDNYNY
jgi:tetratricopeptide (TPR) repeat protein